MQVTAVLLLVVVAVSQASVLKFKSFQSLIHGAETELVKKIQQIKAPQHHEHVEKKGVPKFCNKLGCPPFKVISKTKDYELREYDGSGWVTTALTGISYNTAQYTMFMKLFKYISGMNVKKEKIAMTCPVIVRIIPGQGPACESNFTMSFYVAPNKAKTAAPAPTDKTVYLSKLTKIQAYVRSFGGFASLKDYLKEAKALAKAIGDQSKYETGYYYTAGYDAPFKFLNRHNEVWFIAKAK